jgi:hypothetical protein
MNRYIGDEEDYERVDIDVEFDGTLTEFKNALYNSWNLGINDYGSAD